MLFNMFLFIFTSSVVIIIIYVYFKYSYSYWKRLGIPQLTPTFPFGDMADVIFRKKNMGDKIKEIYDEERGQNHDYVGLYFFSRKAFLPLAPALVKDILSKDFHHFHDRGIYYDEENDPLSAHLFSLAGPKWKTLRAKLTPAYSPVKLRGMFDIISKCGEQMVQVIAEDTEKTGNVEIKEILARYSTDVIGCCAFGLDCNTMRDPDAEFRRIGRRAFTQTVTDVLKMIIIRSFPYLAKLLGIGVFSSNVTAFFRRVVKETVQYRENNNISRKDFMQLLIELKNNGVIKEEEKENKENIEAGTALTIDEAAAQAFIFFLAGFETTSTTTSFALYEMSLNTEMQEKARQEVIKIMRKYRGKLSYDAILELKYLDMIMQETLRKYPPAPVFLRKCTLRYPIPKTNAFIEEGQSVLIPCLGLHRDKNFFPEPDRFDPDRFNEENSSKIVDGTYIPFGLGPRNCIGMRFALIQSKIALALTLLNFDFTLSRMTKLPLVMEKKGIILCPIGGLWINFEPRSCEFSCN